MVKFQLQKAVPRTTIQKLISLNTYIGRGFVNIFRKMRRKQRIRIRHFFVCLGYVEANITEANSLLVFAIPRAKGQTCL